MGNNVIEMKKIIDYVIHRQSQSSELQAWVKGWMSQGWQPLGGVSCDGSGNYMQAMAIFEAEDEMTFESLSGELDKLKNLTAKAEDVHSQISKLP